MRIAHIVGSFGDGKCGVGDFSFHLSSALARLVQPGGGVFVLTSGDAGFAARRHGLKSADSAQSGFSSIAEGLYARGGLDFSIMKSASVESALSEAEPDAVIIEYPSKGYGWTLGAPVFAPKITRKIAKSTGRRIPVFAVIHEYKDAHPLRKRAVLMLTRSADETITPCKLEADALEAATGRRPMIIPDGNVFAEEIDFEEFDRLSKRVNDAKSGGERAALILGARKAKGGSGWEPSPKETAALAKALEGNGVRRDLFFTYGHFAKSKDPEVLFSAFKAVLNELPDARLVIASNIEGEAAAKAGIKRIIEKTGVSAGLLIVGAMPAPALKIMAEKCTAQIFTFRDGFTGKRSSAIGALTFDCPMIVSGAAGEPPTSLIEVPKSSPAALAEKILGICRLGENEYNEWRNRVIRLQHEFREGFAFEKVAAEYMRVLAESSGETPYPA